MRSGGCRGLPAVNGLFYAMGIIGRQIGRVRIPPDLAVCGYDDERRVLSAVTAVGGGAQIPSLPERRGPASVEPRPLLLSSELDLLGNAERVVDLDAEVADCAFELCVSKQSCAIIRILLSH